jgi:hypothetical protein
MLVLNKLLAPTNNKLYRTPADLVQVDGCGFFLLRISMTNAQVRKFLIHYGYDFDDTVKLIGKELEDRSVNNKVDRLGVDYTVETFLQGLLNKVKKSIKEREEE